MGIHARLLTAGTVITLSSAAAGCAVPGLWTYSGPTSAGGASSAISSGTAFDAATYAGSVWDSKVLPAVDARAVDADTLLKELKADPAAAGKKYGVVPSSGAAPSFLVTGSGTVTAVDTASPTGPVSVALAGGEEVELMTGPVILGTALRDAVGIGFGDFTNQIDYQNAATALNTHVKESVIHGVDLSTLKGKKVDFRGAFTHLAGAPINIVPISLKVG